MENQEYKKMVLLLDAGVAGTDSAEFWLVPATATQQELDDLAWERALNHAEMYGIYPESDCPDDYDEMEENMGGDSYSDDIGGWFEEYSPDKHDGLRIGCDDDWLEM